MLALATSLGVVADLVRLTHRGGDMLVVLHQLAQHLARRDIVLVVVLDRLELCDLADRLHRGAADLADALGKLVGGGENRVRLLVEHQMVVAEMPAADVPVEILGLQIQREGVGQQHVERLRNLFDGLPAPDRWGCRGREKPCWGLCSRETFLLGRGH